MALQTEVIEQRHSPISHRLAPVNGVKPATDMQETGRDPRAVAGQTSSDRDLNSSRAQVVLGLIDNHRFSRECLIQVLGESQPQSVTVAYDEPKSFIEGESRPFDAVIMYSHDPVAMQSGLMDGILSVTQAARGAPLIVFSDAHDTHELRTIQAALRNGAQALISTRTTSVQIALAALQLVRVGGVFTSVTLQTEQDIEPAPDSAADTRPSRLTFKQDAVLAQMARGSANKVIAHELNMSESTVKIHVRNIMRKVGATNRTQAVYKAKQLEGYIA